MPDDCGSMSPRTSCTAIAASAAEPPCRRIRYPASTACGLAAATIQCFAVTGCLSVQPDGCSGAGLCASATAGAKSATSRHCRSLLTTEENNAISTVRSDRMVRL